MRGITQEHILLHAVLSCVNYFHHSSSPQSSNEPALETLVLGLRNSARRMEKRVKINVHNKTRTREQTCEFAY